MVTTEVLLAIAAGLSSYLFYNWWKDPLRKIPGPTPLPFFGNALMLNPSRMHMQLYEMAKTYGPIMRISIFNQPIIILNSADMCLEALIRKGTDFQGRPPTPRITHCIKDDVAFVSYDHPSYPLMRRVATKSLKAYGAGVVVLEKLMQEVLQETMEIISSKDGETVDTYQLSYGYVGCVMVSILYGEKFSFDDPICQSMHEMNKGLVGAADPLKNDPIMDIFPVLFKFRKFLFNKTHNMLEETIRMSHEHIQERIEEAKATFDKNQKRGCLDYIIEAQMEERDDNGNQLISDNNIIGLMADLIAGGMETSLSSLSQAFLDLLHNKALTKKLQSEIDENFTAAETIKLCDREKLPLLEAFLHENLRNLSQAALLLPHSTIRDTEIGGYKIPARTRVFFNAYNTAHNPEVYPEPFECKPERFLDDNGNVVPPGHPVRRNFIGFGSGRRQCPGELLARSRIFLFLANILQKFDIEPVGDLPSCDTRTYEMGIIIKPPHSYAKFTPRQ